MASSISLTSLKTYLSDLLGIKVSVIKHNYERDVLEIHFCTPLPKNQDDIMDDNWEKNR